MESTANGVVHVTGDLVFANAVAMLARGEELLAGRRELAFDLGGVDHADSAGLVLLLELLGRGRASGVMVSFHNIPSSLLRIARLSNAEVLLSFER